MSSFWTGIASLMVTVVYLVLVTLNSDFAGVAATVYLLVLVTFVATKRDKHGRT